MNEKRTVSTVFNWIYENHGWGIDGGGSGRGSTVENAASTCKALKYVFKKYELHRLLDAPCGAGEWAAPFVREMRKADPSFEYCGIDVAELAIEACKERFPTDYCSFHVMEISGKTLPSGYDLILCRDAIQHNSYEDLAAMLDSFRESGSRYLLATSFSRRVFEYISAPNRNIETGRFFRNQLLLRPFLFREGLLEVLDDHRPTGVASGHKLLLYDLRVLSETSSFDRFIRKHKRNRR